MEASAKIAQAEEVASEVGTGRVTVCATVHTVSVVMVVTQGATRKIRTRSATVPKSAPGVSGSPFIMLWNFWDAVKVSVVKNVESVTFSAETSSSRLRTTS